MVNYFLDGASLGVSTEENDFYVFQSLQDGTNCDKDYVGGVTSLNGASEPAINGHSSQSTTTLFNTADWPKGTNLICLRLKLMLQMSDDNDLVWQLLDFKFDVFVNFEDGSNDITHGENDNEVAESLPIDNNDVVVDKTGHSDTGGAPTISISFPEEAFPYGTEIPFTIEFHHSLDIFTYNVLEEYVIPIDESSRHLKDNLDRNITLRSSKFAMVSTDHSTGIQGILTITLPLILYQMTSLSTVRILVPVAWTNKARRNNMRALTPVKEEIVVAGGYSSSGQISGIVDGIVRLELLPYVDHDNSGSAITRFNMDGLISAVCMRAATSFFL